MNDKKTTDATPPPSKFGFIFFLFLIIVGSVLFLKSISDDKVENIDATRLYKLIETDKIVSMTVTGSDNKTNRDVKGIYRDNSDEKNFETVIIYDNFRDLITERMSTGKLKCEFEEEDPSWILALLVNFIPFIIIALFVYFFIIKRMQSSGGGAMQFGKSRAKLNNYKGKITFDDVAGIEESKEEVSEIITFLKDPEKISSLGGRIPKGVLLIGAPGTGKTLLAKAIAGEADVPFFSISGSDFVEMFVGVGASRVRDMFQEAKKQAPCLIFIDEIDTVGRARFSGIGGGNDEREQTLNALLVEMDGFDANSGVIVIAATNRPDVLDPALLRPGRFDRQVNILLPTVIGRKEILDVHAKKIKLALSTNLELIARATPGFSGADLENLLNEAALTACRNDHTAVTQDDLDEAREKVHWGRTRKSHKMSEKERRTVAIHESGHALVGIHSKDAMPLQKVTIIPRGSAFLGAAMYLPEEEKYMNSRNELYDQLAVSMGGRIAEEILIGEISNGAAGDIKGATVLAKKMVCQWGMSEELGPLDYSSENESPYTGRGETKAQNHGSSISDKIDNEVRKLINNALTNARNILTTHKDQLVKLSEALLEKETMNSREIYSILDIELPSHIEKLFKENDEIRNLAGENNAINSTSESKDGENTPSENEDAENTSSEKEVPADDSEYTKKY